MKPRILVASAAIAILGCGAAFANTHHHKSQSANYASPDQPVPYSQLDGYVNGGAATGAANQGMAMNQSGMARTGPGAEAGASTMAPTAGDNGSAGNSDTAMGAGTDNHNPGNTNAPVGQPSQSTGAVNPSTGMTGAAPK